MCPELATTEPGFPPCCSRPPLSVRCGGDGGRAVVLLGRLGAGREGGRGRRRTERGSKNWLHWMRSPRGQGRRQNYPSKRFRVKVTFILSQMSILFWVFFLSHNLFFFIHTQVVAGLQMQGCALGRQALEKRIAGSLAQLGGVHFLPALLPWGLNILPVWA